MENLPISVIIIARNAEKTIEECLNSVHSNNPAEVIVVDGNSSDRTVEIAKRYTDKIYSDGGKGLSFARQLGAEQATQEYIAYVDSDVTLTEGALASMLTEFQDSGYINIGATLLPNTSWSSYWEWAESQHNHFHKVAGHINTAAGIFKRETILKYGFRFYKTDVGGVGMDDMDLDIRLRKEGYKFGTSSALYYHHYRTDFKSLARYHFFLGRLAPYYIRRHGLWHAEFWPPLATVYWLGFCLMRGKLRLIPYFIVDGVVRTAGMVKGSFDLIGDWVKERRRATK